MQITKLNALILSIAGGTLLGLSFPFTGSLFPLVFISFAPLLIVNFIPTKTTKTPFFLRFSFNLIYFLIFNAITTWWIYNASEGGAYMAVICNSILMTIPLMLTGLISRQLGENKGLLTFLVLWLSFEYGHYYWELSWPWLSLGHVFGNFPSLIQWYEFSGVTGGSLWVLFANILVYLVIRNVWFKKESFGIQRPIILMLSLVLVLPILSSLFIYYRYDEQIDPVRVVVVQPNIDAYTEKFATPVQDQLNKIFDLAKNEVDSLTDIVICPETAIARGINEEQIEEASLIQSIKNFSSQHYNVPFLIGADTYKFFDTSNSLAAKYLPNHDRWVEGYNTALLIDPNLQTQIYHKAKAVLGAEKLPFLAWFPFLKKYAVELGGTSGMIGLGEEPMNFSSKGLFYAPLICYESVYGDYVSYFTARRADILCVITNDGWWGDTPGYKQHRMFSRIRAIENRRSIARSANTGISCLIDQKGNILQELGWDEAGVIKADLNINKEITFFVRYGDVIGRISIFVALALMLYALTTYLKSRGVKAVN